METNTQTTQPTPLPQAPIWASSKRPWDAARKLKVIRHDYMPEGEIIDRGVNFFVLTLEAIGAKPRFSCEGHINGFYVLFDATHDLAYRIASAGFFTVELCRGHGKNTWAMRIYHEWKTEKDKRQTLRWAAQAWQSAFWTTPPSLNTEH